MPVGDLPLALLAAEDVGDAQGVRLDRDADDRIRNVFEAVHVRQVATDAAGDQVEAVVRAIGPPRRQPAEGKRQNAERLAIGPGYRDGDLLCELDGTPLHPKAASGAFAREVRRAGLPPIPLPGLPHMWATLALHAGINPRAVQQLGHASIVVTLGVYSHVGENVQRDAAARVVALINQSVIRS